MEAIEHNIIKTKRSIGEIKEARQAMLEKLKNSLKPCPLCGGSAIMRKRHYYGSCDYACGTKMVIYCDNCGLELEGPDTSWKDEVDCLEEIDAFVDKWNTRCN